MSFSPYFGTYFQHMRRATQKRRPNNTSIGRGGNWSKYILHYLPRTAAVETTVSFKMYHPMKPVKFWLNMFVKYESSNGYIYNFKSQTCKTKNENPVLLKATWVVKQLYSVLTKGLTNLPSWYHAFTDTKYHRSRLWAIKYGHDNNRHSTGKLEKKYLKTTKEKMWEIRQADML
jgi:hypothetical protein